MVESPPHVEALAAEKRTFAAVQALVAEIERLRAALEPFADVSGEGDEDFPDGTPVTVTFGRSTHYGLKLGDFRRAALASHHGGEA